MLIKKTKFNFKESHLKIIFILSFRSEEKKKKLFYLKYELLIKLNLI